MLRLEAAEFKGRRHGDFAQVRIRWFEGQPCFLRRQQAERRPVELRIAACDAGDESIAHHADRGHRDAGRLRLVEHQSDVLESQLEDETARDGQDREEFLGVETALASRASTSRRTSMWPHTWRCRRARYECLSRTSAGTCDLPMTMPATKRLADTSECISTQGFRYRLVPRCLFAQTLPSVPFPTFVSFRSTCFYERRKQRNTSKS
jgi:hypothetical protein